MKGEEQPPEPSARFLLAGPAPTHPPSNECRDGPPWCTPDCLRAVLSEEFRSLAIYPVFSRNPLLPDRESAAVNRNRLLWEPEGRPTALFIDLDRIGGIQPVSLVAWIPSALLGLLHVASSRERPPSPHASDVFQALVQETSFDLASWMVSQESRKREAP